MVQSKFNTYGVFSIVLCLLMVLGCCLFIYTLASVVFFDSHFFKKGTLSRFDGILIITMFSFFVFVILYSLNRFAFFVSIDDSSKTIFFKNAITRKSKVYNFNDFDSYFDTFSVSKSGAYKNLYLLIDGKAEKVINGFYYSNMEEMKEALSPISYSGFQQDSSAIARRALFNQPVIDLLKPSPNSSFKK